ncbi:hypothetical protein WJX74_006531 [Apatococcus lobatus]|uniref:DAGKc domain-containing protein n=1 Tax=Apatococcus lobatus TaxID=904363 RepID=A0AAW1QLJ6_9CHLO
MRSPRSKERARTLFLVLNGKKIGDEALREAIKRVRQEGHRIEIRVTYEAEDSDRYVLEALRQKGVDTIIAAGGDGMVNQIAAALLAHDAPVTTELGIIPMGTANDFATGLGIPTDPWEALQLALCTPAQPIDVGIVNEQVFLNVATGGFGTEMTTKTDEGMKNSLGGLAYAITGITNIGSISSITAVMKARVVSTAQKEERAYSILDKKQGAEDLEEGQKLLEDGSEVEVDGDLLVLAVGNARQAGGGRQLCPQALVDDGHLDVSYVMNIPMEEIPDVLARMGQTLDSGEMLDCFGSMRVKSLTVDCPDGLQVNRDGEPMRAKKLDFSLQPHRLKVHMANKELLVQPSQTLRHGKEVMDRKIKSAATVDRRQQQQTSISRLRTISTVLQQRSWIGFHCVGARSNCRIGS